MNLYCKIISYLNNPNNNIIIQITGSNILKSFKYNLDTFKDQKFHKINLLYNDKKLGNCKINLEIRFIYSKLKKIDEKLTDILNKLEDIKSLKEEYIQKYLFFYQIFKNLENYKLNTSLEFTDTDNNDLIEDKFLEDVKYLNNMNNVKGLKLFLFLTLLNICSNIIVNFFIDNQLIIISFFLILILLIFGFFSLKNIKVFIFIFLISFLQDYLNYILYYNLSNNYKIYKYKINFNENHLKNWILFNIFLKIIFWINLLLLI